MNKIEEVDQNERVDQGYYLVTPREEFGFAFCDEKSANKFQEKAQKMLERLYKSYGQYEFFCGSSWALEVEHQIEGVHF